MGTKLQFKYGQYTAEQALALATGGVIVFSGITKQVYLDGQAYGGNAAIIDAKIGELSNLKTNEKENLVAAINEVYDDVYERALGMRYNGATADGTLTINTETGDIRPGDMYTVTAEFSVSGTVVEPGDMIIYNGAKTTSPVVATSENSVILERETDDMVTAADNLTANVFVFGDTAKGVKTTQTVEGNPLTISLDAESTSGTTTISSSSNNHQLPTSLNVYDAIRTLSVNVVNGDYQSQSIPGTWQKVTETVSGGVRVVKAENVIGTFKTGQVDVHNPQSPNYVNGIATVEDVQNYIEERFTWKEYETITSAQLENSLSTLEAGGTYNMPSNVTTNSPFYVKTANE